MQLMLYTDALDTRVTRPADLKVLFACSAMNRFGNTKKLESDNQTMNYCQTSDK